MRKFILFMLFLGTIGCSKEHSDTNTGNKDQNAAVNENRITYTQAVANLESLMAAMNSPEQTRTGNRKILSAKTDIVVVPEGTRSAEAEPVDADTLMYILHFEDNGYAIVSADKRVPAVLAITDPLPDIALNADAEEDGNIGQLPPAIDLAQLVSDYSGTENYVQSEAELFDFIKFYATDYALEEIAEYEENATRSFPDWDWNNITWRTVNRVEPMCLTFWHQKAPFNDNINQTLGTTGYAAGCVAIALSQIIAYHQFPKSRKDVVYPWSDIRKVSSYYYGVRSAGTTYQKSWASYLVAAVGLDAKTKYGPESSSNIDKAKAALRSYGYQNVDDYVGGGRWPKIMTCLDEHYPLYMRGTRSGGHGHAWVVDGYWYVYDVNNTTTQMMLHHLNFGWGGAHNGWYKQEMYNTSKNMISYDGSIGDSYQPNSGDAGRNYNKKIEIISYSL